MTGPIRNAKNMESLLSVGSWYVSLMFFWGEQPRSIQEKEWFIKNAYFRFKK